MSSDRWNAQKKGRLDAPSGIITGSSSRWNGTSNTATNSSAPTVGSRLGQVASIATSGRSSIKALTGYDIDNLPTALSMPIDILANPVGIASLLAAIPSGGMSLGALTGTAGLSTARAIGTRAAVDVAAGVVGNKAGELAAEGAARLGLPDWAQTGAALGAGLAAGGVTGAKLNKRLPKAIAEVGAAKTGAKQKAPFSPITDPYILENSEEGLTKLQQVSNLVKGVTGLGVKSRGDVTTILDDVRSTEKVVQEQANLLQASVRDVLSKRPDIKYDKATLIKVGDEWEPLRDVTMNPQNYNLTTDQIAFIKPIADELEAYKRMFRRVGGKPLAEAREGYFLPKGIPTDGTAPARGVTDTPNTLARGLHTSPLESRRVVKEGIKPVETVTNQVDTLLDKGPATGAYPNANPALLGDERAALYQRPLNTLTLSEFEDLINEAEGFTGSDSPALYNMGMELMRNSNPLEQAALDAGYLIVPEKGGRLRLAPLSSNSNIQELEKATVKAAKRWSVLDKNGQGVEDAAHEAAWQEYRAAKNALKEARAAQGVTAEAPLQLKKAAESISRDIIESETFTTVKEGLAAGLTYPPMDEAVRDYALNIGNATIGRRAASRILKLTDNDGRPILKTADDLVNPDVRAALRSSESTLYGAENKVTELSQEITARRVQINELTNLKGITTDADTLAKIDQEIATLSEVNANAVQDLNLLRKSAEEAVALKDSAKTMYDQELGKVVRDPTLGSIDTANFGPEVANQGDKLYGPRETTDAFNSQLNPNGPLTKAGSLAKSVNGNLRLFHTLMDISDFGRLAGAAGLMHPLDFARGIGTGFKTLFSKSALIDDFKGIDQELDANGIKYRVRDFIKYGKMAIGSPDVDLSMVPNIPGKELISRTSSITQNGISSIRAHMIKTELLKMAQRGETVGPEQIEKAVRAVSLTTGSSIHRGVKNADLFVQFPNWLQSQMEYVAHAGAGLIPGASFESKYAANSMMRMITFGLATTYAVNKMQGRETEIKNGVPMMRIGDTNVDPFGPYGALVRGFVAAADGNVEPLIRSRVSPLFQIGWDLGSGQTYMGDVASFDDPAYWAKIAAPYSATGALLPGVDGELKLLQGAGVRATAVPSYKLLQEQAKEVMGMDWIDLSGKQKEQLRLANPELVAKLDEQTQKRAEQGDKKALAAVSMQEATDELLSQQATLDTLWKKGELSSVQLREQLGALNQVNAAKKQQIRKDFGLDKESGTPTRVNTALNDYFDLFNKADRGILSGGAKTNVLDWDVFDKLEAELLSKLDPIQRKAIADRYTRHDPSLDWFYQNKELIGNSGYFEANQQIVDRMKSVIQSVVPGAESYTDIQEAYNRAQREGNVGQVLRLNALINRISGQTTVLHNSITRKSPALYKALIENGYIKQSVRRPLAANIEVDE